MTTEFIVRPAEERDIEMIASINAGVFLGDRDNLPSARQWITCCFRAHPMYQYFVVESDGLVVGYAGWQVHGGFSRAEPVIELDQIGIHPDHQSNGLGRKLIAYSKRNLIDWMKLTNRRIESHVSFVVWAYTLNFHAIKTYVGEFGQSVSGLRTQFGERAESMIRHRVPLVLPVRDEEEA